MKQDGKLDLIGRSRTHLTGVDESYGEHMRFAGAVGWRLIAAGIACLLHALVPAFFPDKASRTIRGLHRIVEDRALAEARLRAIGPRPLPAVPLTLLSLAYATLPWLAGAELVFALPVSLLSMAIPAAYFLAGNEPEPEAAVTA